MPTQHRQSASPGSRAPRSRRRPSWRLLLPALAGILATYAVGFVRTAPARVATVARHSMSADYRDGSYSAWGRARHGRILATVTIRRGRIVSAAITDCRMKYPCSMIGVLPARVVAKQDAAVDIVSGATHSTEAFSRAVNDALGQAVRHDGAP